MSISCSSNVSGELAKAIAEQATDIEGPHAVLYEGSGPAGRDEVESALASGHTLAIAHAPAGPVFGGHIPALKSLANPTALVAVSRRPAGHGYATSITLTPQPRQVESVITDEHGHKTYPPQGPSHEPAPADIVAALDGHLRTSQTQVTDSNLIPPLGAKFGIVHYNITWTDIQYQTDWSENKGSYQRLASNNTMSFYFYYANGRGATPHYVVLAIQNGTVEPTTISPLCCYSVNARTFVLARNLVSLDLLHAPVASRLLACSPATTRSTPVTDIIEIPMTVMAQSGGGYVSTPFTAGRVTSVPNEDWAVRRRSYPTSAQSAGVEYFNITGWDASSQEDFSTWWQQMYGDGQGNGDNVIALNPQCRTSASFDTMGA